jgi:hypothetical protein
MKFLQFLLWMLPFLSVFILSDEFVSYKTEDSILQSSDSYLLEQVNKLINKNIFMVTL